MDPTLSSASWVEVDPQLVWSSWIGRINYVIESVAYNGNAITPQMIYYSVSKVGDVTVWYDHLNGISKDLIITMPGHGHYQWGFSDPGVYEMTFKAWGKHTSDGYKESHGTFRFDLVAVPEPSIMGFLWSGNRSARDCETFEKPYKPVLKRHSSRALSTVIHCA